MRFRIAAGVTCALERNGHTLALEGSDLSMLAALLDGASDAVDGTDLLQRMFALGIVEPEAGDLGAGGARHWRTRFESSGLSPWLVTEVAFLAGTTRIPFGEAASGLFLDSGVVAAVSDLSERLNDALERTASAAAVRGRDVERDQVQSLLEDIARRWGDVLDPSIPIRVTTGSDETRIEIPEELTSTDGALVEAWEAELTFSSAGMRRKVRLPVRELAGIALVLEAVARHDVGASDLTPSAKLVLGAIDSIGGRVPKTELPRTYPPQATDQGQLAVTHMGHGCLIVDSDRTRILVDPWLFPGHADNLRQPLTSAQLGAVDAICFTHHHADHLDLASLLTLPHNVPVIVAAEEDKPFAPRVSRLLGLFGFSDVRTLAPGQTLMVEDVEVEAVPFFGEGRDLLGFAASCFCIASGGAGILVHADASPDSSGASVTRSGALKDLVRRRGDLDVVFGSWWQERTFRCRLSAFAPVLASIPPADWLVDTEQCDCSVEYLQALVEDSGAELFVTYAESAEELFLPEQRRSSYVPAVSLLWRSWDDIANDLRTRTGATVVAAEPYLVISTRPEGRPVVSQAGRGTGPR